MKSLDSTHRAKPGRRPGTSVPSYSLYGESEDLLLPGPLHCESIAERSRLHEWEISQHRHEALFQLMLISSGSGSARIDGLELNLEPPCVVTVPAMTVHGFNFAPDIDGTVITIVQHRLEQLRGMAETGLILHGSPRLVRLRGNEAGYGLAGLVTVLASEFGGGAPLREAAVDALLTLVLVTLSRAAGGPDSDSEFGRIGAGELLRDRAGQRARYHLERYRRLIERHYREHRPLGFYAGRLGLTTTQLNRICREHLAQSALGVIHARLALEAQRDLAYTMLGIQEIALTLGFSDPAYFSRFFQKVTGRSPSAFREQARLQLAASPAIA